MINRAKNLSIETRAFIDGGFRSSVAGETIPKLSPVDGSNIPAIASCQKGDVDVAVEAAMSSFRAGIWANTELEEKKKVCFELAALMEENREELALLDTLETGRAYANYYYDSIPKAISALRYFTEGVDKFYDTAISQRPGVLANITSQPLGAVGLITPWNDPMVVTIWKLAPALLMGNSVVLKPAEQSTYSALKLASLAQRAGLPAGVLNVIPGYGHTAGKALALHRDIRGIFFTGSSSTGKKILSYSGESNMKKLGLECGGKSAFLVSRACKDLPQAVSVLARNVFYNQGQICSAPTRAFVDRAIMNDFMDLMEKEMEAYIPSDPFAQDTRVGCVVSKEQQQKIERYIEIGQREAVRVLRPRIDGELIPGGAYVVPVVFEFANQASVVAREEIFGPVLSVFGFDTIDQAISEANDSDYGLAASIWSDDINEALYVSGRLESGIVHVNSYGEDDNSVPFGGIKESGIGKDKSLLAFHEYSYLKSTWIRYSSPS